MINLKVDSGSKIYPLFIGIDIVARLSELYQLYGYKSRAALITDLNLKESGYFDLVVENFKKINIEIMPVVITAQGAEDGLVTAQQAADQLVKHKFKSDETIISLGGSRVGNISAFISKIIYGGVTYFQIPTTLAAQVVQSVKPLCYLNSGSTVNLFFIEYERNLVLSDVAMLKSLPEKSIITGLGYIIQSAWFQNNGFFEFLETNLGAILDLNLEILEQTVYQSCQNRISRFRRRGAEPKNPKLTGFGELFASIIIEIAPNRVEFGEALLMGMLVEAIIMFRKGVLSNSTFEKFYQLLKRIPFHYFIDQIDPEQLIDSLRGKIPPATTLALSLPEAFGKLTAYPECKLSDFISAIKFVFAN